MLADKIMTRTSTLFALLLCSLSAASQTWQVLPHYEDENGVYIKYGHDGFGDFKTALDAIGQSKTLLSLYMGRLVQIDSDTLQPDIMAYLKRNYPGDLNLALSSAGNPHNPKVIALHDAVKEAVLHTRFFKGLNDILHRYGYRIKSVSFEKFFLIKETGSVRFDAMTWLDIGKL